MWGHHFWPKKCGPLIVEGTKRLLQQKSNNMPASVWQISVCLTCSLWPICQKGKETYNTTKGANSRSNILEAGAPTGISTIFVTGGKIKDATNTIAFGWRERMRRIRSNQSIHFYVRFRSLQISPNVEGFGGNCVLINKLILLSHIYPYLKFQSILPLKKYAFKVKQLGIICMITGNPTEPA